jgi:hypothetical protein
VARCGENSLPGTAFFDSVGMLLLRSYLSTNTLIRVPNEAVQLRILTPNKAMGRMARKRIGHGPSGKLRKEARRGKEAKIAARVTG